VDPLVRRRELATFLRSRRRRIDPRDHGLDPGRRLAPGLRREEVCALAGVSLSWYTWLEQARDIRPSADVLTSIGRVLLLGPAEQEYLLRLAGHVPAPDIRGGDPHADPQLQALADGFFPNPASIITPCFDYVAWNRTSERLVPGFLGCATDAAYNLARFVFGGQAMRVAVEGPEEGPRNIVARLRVNAARHPDDAAIGELADELSDASPEFAALWRLREVAPSWPLPDVALEHPDVGRLVFQEIHLTPSSHPELTLVVFLPKDEITAGHVDRLATTR
jgi:transcriptional regulator with XRE-family HTH domain